MTPGEAVEQAKKGKLLPLYLVAGEERLLRDEVVAALRAAALAGGVAAFNEDKFTAGEVDVDAVISAARTAALVIKAKVNARAVVAVKVLREMVIVFVFPSFF